MNINFERAYLLLLLIKEAGLHGATYKKIADAARTELETMMTEEEPEAVETTVEPEPLASEDHTDMNPPEEEIRR